MAFESKAAVARSTPACFHKYKDLHGDKASHFNLFADIF